MRSAPCTFKIVAKGFSLHYFLNHPWIWLFSDLSYKTVLLPKVELTTESYRDILGEILVSSLDPN